MSGIDRASMTGSDTLFVFLRNEKRPYLATARSESNHGIHGY